jgi:AraC family transcriptional regulator of adaptative response / DNA-3-methyladenine glycosylase II
MIPDLPPEVCHRAVDARDARFDGVFLVAITTTRIYCRPTCPSRRATPTNRRFFRSVVVAERAGFRPCLRCRPELAPGRSRVDAVARLARAAVDLIACGALNGHSVAELASALCVSERQLRRALRREAGVTPLELAQTQRLLLARQLLADTSLSITRIAFASGFNSLRRFNGVFKERFGMAPRALRQASVKGAARARAVISENRVSTLEPEPLRLTLAYRPPLAWLPLLAMIRRYATPGIEAVVGARYGRAVFINGYGGVVFVEDLPVKSCLLVDISASLLPVLMPLLVRLRRLFDLDAEPAIIAAHLEEGGLGNLIAQRPGLRLPGAFDGFEFATTAILTGGAPMSGQRLVSRLVEALGESVEGGALRGSLPSAVRIVEVGLDTLHRIGISGRRAETVLALAGLVAGGDLRLEPGSDARSAWRALRSVGINRALATTIVVRALSWPDTFPATDVRLQRLVGVSNPSALRSRAESWRPWRSYAALHFGFFEPDIELARARQP